MDNIVVQRPEFVREVETSAYGVVEKPLTTGEKIFNNAAVRKGILLVLLAIIWQVYATMLANPLLFPKFSDASSRYCFEYRSFSEEGSYCTVSSCQDAGQM